MLVLLKNALPRTAAGTPVLRVTREYVQKQTGIHPKILSSLSKGAPQPFKSKTLESLVEFFFLHFKEHQGYPPSVRTDAEVMRWVVSELVGVYPEDPNYWPRDSDRKEAFRRLVTASHEPVSSLFNKQR